jgi:hypothetical protein
MPGARTMQPTLEKIEPGLLITYGDTANEISVVLGSVNEPTSKYRFKDGDLSMEKITCVVMV